MSKDTFKAREVVLRSERKRVVWLAEAALKAHSEGGRIDSRSCAIDLIADVLHWCTEQGIDVETVLRLAKMHWETEQAEFKEATE